MQRFVSKEQVFIANSYKHLFFPELASPLIAGAERVSSLRVLGVLLNSKLTMTEHITAILSTCSSSTYALRLLRSHGFQPQELHLVARATTVEAPSGSSTRRWRGGDSLARRLLSPRAPSRQDAS